MTAIHASFEIENLKCGGCLNTISKAIQEFTETTGTVVDMENSMVSFNHPVEFDVDAVKVKLAGLGYPESGRAEGFSKMIGVARSYVSCAVGKMTK